MDFEDPEVINLLSVCLRMLSPLETDIQFEHARHELRFMDFGPLRSMIMHEPERIVQFLQTSAHVESISSCTVHFADTALFKQHPPHPTLYLVVCPLDYPVNMSGRVDIPSPDLMLVTLHPSKDGLQLNVPHASTADISQYRQDVGAVPLDDDILERGTHKANLILKSLTSLLLEHLQKQAIDANRPDVYNKFVAAYGLEPAFVSWETLSQFAEASNIELDTLLRRRDMRRQGFKI